MSFFAFYFDYIVYLTKLSFTSRGNTVCQMTLSVFYGLGYKTNFTVVNLLSHMLVS